MEKTLLEAIGSDALKDRVIGVAQFASQLESYSRTLALVQGGLAMRIGELRDKGAFTGEAAQRLTDFQADLFSAQASTNEVVNWVSLQCDALLSQAVSLKHEPEAAETIH